MNIYEINFMLKTTKVHRKSLDRIADLVQLENKNNLSLLNNSLKEGANFDVDAFHKCVDAPHLYFTFISMAVVHCYSLVECNRALMMSEFLKGYQRRKGVKIGYIDSFLHKNGITHKSVRCYKTMNEFRIVNGAIKHNRTGLGTTVLADNGKTYASKQMDSLYRRAKHLETYLNDLYKRLKELT